MGKKLKPDSASPAALELVLGAGGVKGYAHIGVLQAIEKYNVAIGNTTGVSIGSLIAAFFKNGYSAAEIERIFQAEDFMGEGAKTLHRWRQALSPRAVQRAGLTNLAPIFQKAIRKYKLVPQDDLTIIAFNVSTLSPVRFSGRDYNLANALAASCAVPFVMQPVCNLVKEKSQSQAQWLIDGFMYHTHPSSFCSGPAIISKLGFASALPSELLPAGQMLLHLGEMLNAPLLNWLFDDPKGGEHILIQSGMPDVAALSFGTSAAKCKQMIGYARQQALIALRQAKSSGKLPLAS